jgi:hypothetical protein
MMIMAINLVILEEESMDILELLAASKESADKGNLQVTLVLTHIMIHIALLVPALLVPRFDLFEYTMYADSSL